MEKTLIMSTNGREKEKQNYSNIYENWVIGITNIDQRQDYSPGYRL